jgi:hypothetical protein
MYLFMVTLVLLSTVSDLQHESFIIIFFFINDLVFLLDYSLIVSDFVSSNDDEVSESEQILLLPLAEVIELSPHPF